MKRRFIDAPHQIRCMWNVTLRDGSLAQCGRAKTSEHFCTQHAKMAASFSCAYCGGNDEAQPGHCEDCTRPTDDPEAVPHA